MLDNELNDSDDEYDEDGQQYVEGLLKKVIFFNQSSVLLYFNITIVDVISEI